MNVLSMLAWWQSVKDRLRPFPKTIGPAGPWKVRRAGRSWEWVRTSTVAPCEDMATVYLDKANDVLRAKIWRHDSNRASWTGCFDRQQERKARQEADRQLEALYAPK
jgi:hypothetical protein